VSVRKQRCLLFVAGTAWATWIVALAASLILDVGGRHILMQYAVLAVAVMTTFYWIVVSATAPVVSALRALLAVKECDQCAARRSAGRAVIPLVTGQPPREHAHLS
jgi:hypothetical protein